MNIDLKREDCGEKLRFCFQKHILPLYRKDMLGNLLFEATLTLVKYKGKYFALTAAHAVDEGKSDYGLFVNHENISSRADIHIFLDLDLVVLNFHFVKFPDRLYFNLDEVLDYSLYEQEFFLWSGFPSAKTKNFYKKDPEKEIAASLNGNLITTAKTLLAKIEFLESFNPAINGKIIGYKDLNDVKYNKEGYKSKGYSFKGMSGGALCLLKRSPKSIEESLSFIGIGLEHKKNNEVIGLSLKRIIEKLDEIVKEPFTLNFMVEPSFALDPILDFIVTIHGGCDDKDRKNLQEWIEEDLISLLETLKHSNNYEQIPILALKIRTKLNDEQLKYLIHILENMEVNLLEKEKLILSLINLDLLQK